MLRFGSEPSCQHQTHPFCMKQMHGCRRQLSTVVLRIFVQETVFHGIELSTEASCLPVLSFVLFFFSLNFRNLLQSGQKSHITSDFSPKASLFSKNDGVSDRLKQPAW